MLGLLPSLFDIIAPTLARLRPAFFVRFRHYRDDLELKNATCLTLLTQQFLPRAEYSDEKIFSNTNIHLTNRERRGKSSPIFRRFAKSGGAQSSFLPERWVKLGSRIFTG
jgi:hypothetical protein